MNDDTTNVTTGTYTDANAGTDKKVTYKLGLAATGTGDVTNYKFVDANGNVQTNVIGTGTINKRDLTLSVNTSPTKTYNGKAAVDADLSVDGYFTLNDGTVGNSVLAADHTKLVTGSLNAVYGLGATDATFEADANAGSKSIQYSNVQAALGENAQNYNIADTVYGTGTIGRKKIDSDAFKFSINDITREYNGKTAVDDTTNGKATRSYVKDHYVELGLDSGDNPTFDYTITSAEYDTKDAGTKKKVTYTISILPVSLDNYEIDTTGGIIKTAVSESSTITPREIYASVTGPVSKTYDTQNTVKSGNRELKGSDLINLVDANGNAGLLTNDSSSNNSSAVYTDINAGTGKTVNYTIALDDNNKGNYAIYNLADKGNTSKKVITTLSTNDNAIEKYGLKLTFGDVTKVYDGTANVISSVPSMDGPLTGDVGKVSLATGYTAVYNSPNVKTATTVTYDGLRLDGTAAGNYTLADATGKVLPNSTTTGLIGTQATTGNGTITKYKLNDGDLNFGFNPITKEYDATNVVSYQGDSSGTAISHYIKGATVNVNGKNQALVYDASSAQYGNANDAGVNAGPHTVTFTVGLSGDNYDFTGLSSAAGYAQDAKGNYMITKDTTGEITKRKVYASLTNNPTDSAIVKTYDGTDRVLRDTTGKVAFRDGDLLTSKDGVTLDTSKIDAHYVDANAGTNKDVYYGLALKGDAASNYEIHDLTKIGDNSNDGAISQLAGKGTINKKELTALFDRQEKDYDGNSKVNQVSPILSGLVEKDDGLRLDNTKITGEYGTWDASTGQFKKDENVNRDAAGNVTDKGVYYTGIADALAAGGTIAQNYTIADTMYFDEAAGKGRIKPLAITQAALANWTQVTKEYDATKDVPTDKQKNALGLSVTGTLDNAPIILDYKVKTAIYDDQNAGKNHTLSYTISDVNKNLGNYQLSDDAAATIRDTIWTSAADNIITPRTINASLLKDKDVTKVYDGTRSADARNLVVDKDDAAVLAKDGLSAVITAAYDGDANATINPGASHTNAKNVTYTLGLAASSPNYSISTTTYTATGDIERQTLDVVADPVTVNVGAVMPTAFFGTVKGLISADQGLASGFIFHVDGAATTSAPHNYGIYGWYNNQQSGQLGQNYIFRQSGVNATAFRVLPNDPGMEYNNTVNPKGQFTPDKTSYQQASKDQVSGFNGRPEAALEYRDRNGSVMRTTSVAADSSSITSSQITDVARLGRIGVSEGNVVNLSSARVANTASVAVDSSGTVVNLEIVPITARTSDRQARAAIESAI